MVNTTNTPLSAERLAEIRDFESKATEGPWDVTRNEFVRTAEGNKRASFMSICSVNRPVNFVIQSGKTVYGPYVEQANNAAFIATARTAVPELLAEVDRLRASLVTLVEAADVVVAGFHGEDIREADFLLVEWATQQARAVMPTEQAQEA